MTFIEGLDVACDIAGIVICIVIAGLLWSIR